MYPVASIASQLTTARTTCPKLLCNPTAGPHVVEVEQKSLIPTAEEPCKFLAPFPNPETAEADKDTRTLATRHDFAAALPAYGRGPNLAICHLPGFVRPGCTRNCTVAVVCKCVPAGFSVALRVVAINVDAWSKCRFSMHTVAFIVSPDGIS